MPPLTLRLGMDPDPDSKPGGSQAIAKGRTDTACIMLVPTELLSIAYEGLLHLEPGTQGSDIVPENATPRYHSPSPILPEHLSGEHWPRGSSCNRRTDHRVLSLLSPTNTYVTLGLSLNP